MQSKNVLVLLNAFWNYGPGMSDGDQMLIQVFKRIRNHLGLPVLPIPHGLSLVKDFGRDKVFSFIQ